MEGLNEGAAAKPLTTERLAQRASGRLFSAGLLSTISSRLSHPPQCPRVHSSFEEQLCASCAKVSDEQGISGRENFLFNAYLR